MEVCKDSFVSEDEFDFGNIIAYFKIPFDRLRSKYEVLMDPLSDQIRYLPEPKRIKYTKLMVNIVTHLSVLSRIIENEIENMDIDILQTDLKSDVEINCIVD